MATAKTVFLAKDNSEFATEAEADAYDSAQELTGKVEEYIAASKLGKGPAGLLRRHLPLFHMFTLTGKVQGDGEEEPGQTGQE